MMPKSKKPILLKSLNFQWGEWSGCSITCGNVGEGLVSRGRHIAIEAKYGGRQCSGTLIFFYYS